MISIQQVELKVKVNKAGEEYIHVKTHGKQYCPRCKEKMTICGSKRRKYKVYLNRNHRGNAYDILELNSGPRPGLDGVSDADEITFEYIVFTVPVFLCRNCKESKTKHTQHFHRGIVKGMMQPLLRYGIKTMCDMAAGEEMPAELCSDSNDVFQTKRMITRITRFAHSAHITGWTSFHVPDVTDFSGRRKLFKFVRRIIIRRMKIFLK